MAIKKTKHLYEVLFRFDAGGFKGAHVIDLERVADTRTGEVFSQTPGVARPVTLEEVGELIGAESAGLIEKAGAEEARANGLKAELEAVRGELEAITAERDALSAKLAAAAAALA